MPIDLLEEKLYHMLEIYCVGDDQYILNVTRRIANFVALA